MWTVGAAAGLLLVGCGGDGGGSEAWDGDQFRVAAQQQIRQDQDADEVICEAPASTEMGWEFPCRAPYTATNGNAAWNDYEVKIVGESEIEVTPAGSGGG
jgi:hypothetical protein